MLFRFGAPTNKILTSESSYFAEWAAKIEKHPQYLIKAAKTAQDAVDFICARIDLLTMADATSTLHGDEQDVLEETTA